MPNRFDVFTKQQVRAAVEGRGFVETDAEVPAETRRIDLWFTPDPGKNVNTEHLGLLGRITSAACTFEFFHCTPRGEELAACLAKHAHFRHYLSLRKIPPPLPLQWVISSGRPDTGIEGLAFRPMLDWPSGVYEGPRLHWTRLVVVHELPVTRDTLLLRLHGAGRVLTRAIAELKALPPDAPERTLVLPILLRCRLDVPPKPRSRPGKTRSSS